MSRFGTLSRLALLETWSRLALLAVAALGLAASASSTKATPPINAKAKKAPSLVRRGFLASACLTAPKPFGYNKAILPAATQRSQNS